MILEVLGLLGRGSFAMFCNVLLMFMSCLCGTMDIQWIFAHAFCVTLWIYRGYSPICDTMDILWLLTDHVETQKQ